MSPRRLASGSVRLLFILQEFGGWEANPSWGDLTFYMQHGDSIERIAIVGDERWRGDALMFASADLRRAPVEFFSEAPSPRRAPGSSRDRDWLKNRASQYQCCEPDM